MAEHSDSRDSLVTLLSRHAVEDGVHETIWPGLTTIRSSQPTPILQGVYKPCLCIVAQGRKRVIVGDESLFYDPWHYLVVAVPLPVSGQITEAVEQRPFVSMMLEIDAVVLSQLILDMYGGSIGPSSASTAAPGFRVSPMPEELLEATRRFLKCLDSPMERRVLAPGAMREMLYHVLLGEQGESLRALPLRDCGSHRIARIVRYIEENHEEALDVDAIARTAGMSTSTLFHSFKTVTSMSPMQYLKKIRLHRARDLLVVGGLSAGEAGFRVGYNSASQFSREFKRLFGVPPSRVSQTLYHSTPDA